MRLTASEVAGGKSQNSHNIMFFAKIDISNDTAKEMCNILCTHLFHLFSPSFEILYGPLVGNEFPLWPHAFAIWPISRCETGRFAARFGPFRTIKQAVSQRAVRQCVVLYGEDAPPQGAQDEKRAVNAAPKNLKSWQSIIHTRPHGLTWICLIKPFI